MLEPFRASHLFEFTPRHEGSTIFNDRLRLWRLAQQYESQALAWTMRDREANVIACAGVYIEPPGVGYVWLLASDLITQHPVAVYRGVTRKLNEIILWFNLHRLHTLVTDGFPVSVRWLERLGFNREATLRKAGANGEDQHVFARIL